MLQKRAIVEHLCIDEPRTREGAELRQQLMFQYLTDVGRSLVNRGDSLCLKSGNNLAGSKRTCGKK